MVATIKIAIFPFVIPCVLNDFGRFFPYIPGEQCALSFHQVYWGIVGFRALSTVCLPESGISGGFAQAITYWIFVIFEYFGQDVI